MEQESTTVDSNCMHPKVWSHEYINSSIKLKQQMNKQISADRSILPNAQALYFFTALDRSILRSVIHLKAHAYA